LKGDERGRANGQAVEKNVRIGALIGHPIPFAPGGHRLESGWLDSDGLRATASRFGATGDRSTASCGRTTSSRTAGRGLRMFRCSRTYAATSRRSSSGQTPPLTGGDDRRPPPRLASCQMTASGSLPNLCSQVSRVFAEAAASRRRSYQLGGRPFRYEFDTTSSSSLLSCCSFATS